MGVIELSDNKYMVTMRDKAGKTLRVDVYDTLDAFPITCPALQHLTKKALFAGRRGHKDQLQDLLDIRVSADRAIELYHSRRTAEEAQEDREHLQKISECTLGDPVNKLPSSVRDEASEHPFVDGITFIAKNDTNPDNQIVATAFNQKADRLGGVFITYRFLRSEEYYFELPYSEFFEKFQRYYDKQKLNKFDLCTGQVRQSMDGLIKIKIRIVENFFSQFYSELSGHYHTLKNSDIIEQYPVVIK